MRILQIIGACSLAFATWWIAPFITETTGFSGLYFGESFGVPVEGILYIISGMLLLSGIKGE